jgi:glucose-6-phosphate 3-dehydrogenase
MEIGIVGSGRIALTHACALASLGEVDRIVVAGRDPQRLEPFRSVSDRIEVTSSLPWMAGRVDAFIVCTPNDTHRTLVEQVCRVKNGTPFLCEKPLAAGLVDARAIVSLAPPGSGVAFNCRFHPAFHLMRHYVLERRFGAMMMFDARYLKDSALRRREFTWRDGAGQGVSSGAFGDLGSHLLDLFAWLAGVPIDRTSMRAAVATRVPYKESCLVAVDDHALVVGLATDGTPFRLCASKSTPAEQTGFVVEAQFEQALLRYDSSDGRVLSIEYLNGQPTKRIDLGPEIVAGGPDWGIPYWYHALVEQDRAWLQAIGKTGSDVATLGDGLAVQALIEHLVTGSPA